MYKKKNGMKLVPKSRSKNRKNTPCENVMCKRSHGMERIFNLINNT